MPVREWNVPLGADKIGVTKNASPTAVAGGAGSLGGTVMVRLLVDDAVTTSKLDIMRALEILEQRIVEDTYPPA